MIWIPPGAVRLFLDALTQLGQGRAVTIAPGKAELTTQEVADYLNVSCPYVVKLIESASFRHGWSGSAAWSRLPI
jgi:hypothetical protein